MSMFINKNTYIGDTGKQLKDITTSLSDYVLYNNSAGATTDITLDDNYTNYKYFDITFQDTWVGCLFTQRVDLSLSTYFMAHANISRSGYNGFMMIAKQFYFTNYNKIYKNQYADFVGIYFNYYQTNHQWFNYTDYDLKIVKVVGWK